MITSGINSLRLSAAIAMTSWVAYDIANKIFNPKDEQKKYWALLWTAIPLIKLDLTTNKALGYLAATCTAMALFNKVIWNRPVQAAAPPTPRPHPKLTAEQYDEEFNKWVNGREINYQLMCEWVKSKNYRWNIVFEGEALLRIDTHYKSKSLQEWVKQITLTNPKGYVRITESLDSKRLIVYGNKGNIGEIEQVHTWLKGLGLTVSRTTSDKLELGQPACLKRMDTKKPPQKARETQVMQILEATGEDAPHTAVMGAHPVELELILSQTGLLIFKFDIDLCDTKQHQELLDYLGLYPDALLYASSAFKLEGAKIKNRVIFGLVDDKVYASNLYKKVILEPLTKQECIDEITLWAKGKISAVAIRSAVSMAFLLHGKETGPVYMFTKDLLERALNNSQGDVTLQHVWKTFIPMYGLQKSKISLVRISMALKKEFGVEFIVKEVELSQPPEYLTDLNEKLKEIVDVPVVIPERMNALEDSLIGEYKNALIIGESGTGKTTLVKLAAWMSANQKFKKTHPLYGKTIYQLNPDTFMKDTSIVGQQEGKISELFNFLLQSKNGVLFIDEVHLIMGVGAYRGNEMGTFAQHMKTYLEESGIMVIGATTKKEYERWVEGDAAFVRRFNPVDLKDPTEEQVLEIMRKFSESTVIREIASELKVLEEQLQKIVAEEKTKESEISIVDRAKKAVEGIAKSARREAALSGE